MYRYLLGILLISACISMSFAQEAYSGFGTANNTNTPTNQSAAIPNQILSPAQFNGLVSSYNQQVQSNLSQQTTQQMSAFPPPPAAPATPTNDQNNSQSSSTTSGSSNTTNSSSGFPAQQAPAASMPSVPSPQTTMQTTKIAPPPAAPAQSLPTASPPAQSVSSPNYSGFSTGNSNQNTKSGSGNKSGGFNINY